MCRNIRTLFDFDPPATAREIRDASLQFVRKLSGHSAPSQADPGALDQAVDAVARVASRLIASLVTNAVPKSREGEAASRGKPVSVVRSLPQRTIPRSFDARTGKKKSDRP